MKIYPWIRAARIKTLVASIVPILSSIAILPNIKQVNITILALTISAALIIQIVTNYINDLFDFIKGADRNRVGPTRMLQSGLINENYVTLASASKSDLVAPIRGSFVGTPNLKSELKWDIQIICI